MAVRDCFWDVFESQFFLELRQPSLEFKVGGTLLLEGIADVAMHAVELSEVFARGLVHARNIIYCVSLVKGRGLFGLLPG